MQRYCFFRTYASARKKKTQKTQKNCILYDFSLSGLPICEKIADIAIFRQIGFDVLTIAPEFDLIFALYTEYRVRNTVILIFFRTDFRKKSLYKARYSDIQHTCARNPIFFRKKFAFGKYIKRATTGFTVGCGVLCHVLTKSVKDGAKVILFLETTK